jgi:hypothetical protein
MCQSFRRLVGIKCAAQLHTAAIRVNRRGSPIPVARTPSPFPVAVAAGSAAPFQRAFPHRAFSFRWLVEDCGRSRVNRELDQNTTALSAASGRRCSPGCSHGRLISPASARAGVAGGGDQYALGPAISPKIPGKFPAWQIPRLANSPTIAMYPRPHRFPLLHRIKTLPMCCTAAYTVSLDQPGDHRAWTGSTSPD